MCLLSATHLHRWVCVCALTSFFHKYLVRCHKNLSHFSIDFWRLLWCVNKIWAVYVRFRLIVLFTRRLDGAELAKTYLVFRIKLILFAALEFWSEHFRVGGNFVCFAKIRVFHFLYKRFYLRIFSIIYSEFKFDSIKAAWNKLKIELLWIIHISQERNM